ncbi:FecR domain-containing protein [Mucilaginibacter sp. PAMB04274]|uniref:FecR family protein n=1 Tax=Mucilaginibacter sp. PAMB04274 TaxID=3138568 RepID=UPI0031F6221E
MNRFEELFAKFNKHACTPQEQEELMQYLDSEEYDKEIKKNILARLLEVPVDKEDIEDETEYILQKINAEIDKETIVPFYRKHWWLVAATILLLGTITLLRFGVDNEQPVLNVKARVVKPIVILPGGNKAILTTANGNTISLTTAANGTLANISGVDISKTSDSQLRFTTQNKDEPVSEGINTLTTPKGGNYDIFLADGTHVWLNAGSTLTFPTIFNSAERQVSLTGEGYFEVVHNGKPFIVHTATQTIQVLGTHFNVEAYSDEHIVRTTLLQGAVKVIRGTENILLTPGLTTINDGASKLYTVKADIEETMAWKNGQFIFDDTSIAEVMRKASRWYDVEVEIKDNVGDKKLLGTVSKYKTVNELLDVVALAGKIRYKIEGRRITLMR